ncbi:bifunctional 4-hydroxy-2-oxoglutarate aldolase/2-dehydro-3-deoxy-phosphogluconate aldolase [Hymenobacter sp. BT175]|uniref:bifunctional 4-hydroxy-2-oxoglutarate aldolase/2-dehydro-3-deoxy-phosphogluconate aldolase n=1 Tax=Hymenobacter translucens TaxID=2886507 RepID=UPI001D0E250B|nr:bifunctional 4-hydroxy-2-oxoglutarate aldolase/2-dehydro-3-deoxy-phosphogluconate aldolase [Hymenobacter translucens]MCC2547489.1 bifunctional 4-hydroxy-2-oxoglutarate aldolase/2-dehydro-3-deoxy-phosphogluconate aldolase [Hymenobacter translucens]
MPRYSSADVLSHVLRAPLVPVFFHADPAYAKNIVQACYDGGIRVFEFTNRGANAFDVFQELASFVRASCPEMLLGIGTIYTAADAERFVAVGADFIVQPCTTAEVAEVCRRHDVAWVPGAMTITEIYQATQLGAQLVKVFPGNVVGPDFIRSLRGPMPNVPIMVTGGVEPTTESLTEWFGAGVNVVGIGSQLFKGAADAAALAPRIALLMQFLSTRPS